MTKDIGTKNGQYFKVIYFRLTDRMRIIGFREGCVQTENLPDVFEEFRCEWTTVLGDQFDQDCDTVY